MPVASIRLSRRATIAAVLFSSLVFVTRAQADAPSAGPAQEFLPDAPFWTVPPAPPVPQQGPMTVFLSFDGETFTSGSVDDSRTNTVTNPMLAGPFTPFGEGGAREALIQAVEADWDGIGINFVTTRPEAGDYAMVAIGPDNPYGPGTLGIAPVDCGNSNRTMIAFAFHWASEQRSPAIMAMTVGQELAHTFGLEHTQNSNGIMAPNAQGGGDPVFLDSCRPVVGMGQENGICSSFHQRHCESGQNSKQELLGLFGDGTPGEPPTVSFASPPAGATFEPGEKVQVVVDADATYGVSHVVLAIDGEAQGFDDAAPFDFEVAFPMGTFELTATAVTGSGLEASATRTIFVGVEPPADTGVDGDDSGGDASGSGTGGTDGGGAAEGGGGCRSPGATPTLFGCFALGLACLRRRRHA